MAIEVNAMFKVCIAVLTFVALTLAFPDNSYGKDKRDAVLRTCSANLQRTGQSC